MGKITLYILIKPNPYEHVIIYRDEHFIAVNKPPGLLCVPGLIEPGNLFDQIKISFESALVVHRLDMGTSGVIVFALHKQAQIELGRLFEQRKVKKTYIAEVHGIIIASNGEIHAPLICDWPARPRQKIDWIQGKASSTTFKVLSRNRPQNSSRVQLTPFTGRSHQLRVHMLQIGHPILGDALYAPSASDASPPRLRLHSMSLAFVHPFSKQVVTIYCAPDF